MENRELPFIEDIYKPNMLFAKLIRAKENRGTIISIDIPEDVKSMENLFIADNNDIQGDPFITVEGDKAPLFANKEIQYIGQPVLIIAHPDKRILAKVCGLIQVKVEKKKPFVLTERIPDPQNIKERIVAEEREQYGNPDSFIKNSEKTVEQSYFTGMQEHFYSAHQGVIIEYGDKNINIKCSTEWEALVQNSVASVMNVEKKNIHVETTKSSPSFGGKIWYPALLAAQAAVIAQKAKQDIKLVITKEEDILFTTKRAPLSIRKITALDNENNITAEKTEIFIDGGAFPLFTKIMIETLLMATTGCYKKVPSSTTVRVLSTNYPSMDFFSGTMEAQLLFMIERHEENIAKAISKDPEEWKISRLNKDAKNANIEFLLNESLKKSDYRRKVISYNREKENKEKLKTVHRRRGIGFAMGYQNNQIIKNKNIELSITLKMKNSKTVEIKTPILPESKKTKDIWGNCITSNLKVNTENISFIKQKNCKDLGAPFLFNHILSISNLLEKGAKELSKKAKTETFPIVEKTSLPTKKNSLTYGVATVEVEVDPISFEVEPKKIIIAVEGFKIFNRKYIIQRIRTALIQSLHWATVDQKPGTLNNRINLVMKTPTKLPKIEILLESNPHKESKGIGELMFSIIPAAFISAASQALNENINRLPLHEQEMETKL